MPLRHTTGRHKRYVENLRLHLGSKAGIFKVTWLDPTSPSSTPLYEETITWNPALSSCCTVTSPKYPYDIVLKIAQ